MRAGDPANRPRLSGPRVALVPLPPGVARAVCDASSDRLRLALEAVGLRAADGWPDEGTAPAMLGLTLDLSPEEGPSGAGSSTWLVTTDGVVVGECGDRGGPDERGEVEIGYGLCTGARGQGLATEAVALLCAWAERQPGVTMLVAEVRVANGPSLRLLRRLGFVPDGVRAGSDPHRRLVRPAAAPGRPRGRHVC